MPDLTQPVVQHLTDGELFYIIQNGVRWTGMPAWRVQHSQEDSWRLVTFVRKLSTLTKEDLDSLKEMSEHPGGTGHHHHGHDHPDHEPGSGSDEH